MKRDRNRCNGLILKGSEKQKAPLSKVVSGASGNFTGFWEVRSDLGSLAAHHGFCGD
jgi:hypothetical protein